MDVKKVLEFALISFTKFFCERKFSCNIILIHIKHVLLYIHVRIRYNYYISTLVQVDKVCAKFFISLHKMKYFLTRKICELQ